MSGQLKDLHREVEALKRTQKVIHVNEISTMSRINRILRKAEKAASYQKSVLTTLKQLASRIETPISTVNEDKPKLVIIVTSNRGFCGSYNIDVVQKSKEVLEGLEKKPKLLVIGRQGYKNLQREGHNIVEYIDKPVEDITLEDTAELTSKVLQEIHDGEISSIEIIYTKYEDALHSTVTESNLFPLDAIQEEDEEVEDLDGILDFEEDEEEILSLLSENYLCGLLYNLLLSSVASEYCARRMAMYLARESIQERLRSVIQLEHKEKMQASTRELFDIITSARAIGENENE